jgi:hypothetical protein
MVDRSGNHHGALLVILTGLRSRLLTLSEILHETLAVFCLSDTRFTGVEVSRTCLVKGEREVLPALGESQNLHGLLETIGATLLEVVDCHLPCLASDCCQLVGSDLDTVVRDPALQLGPRLRLRVCFGVASPLPLHGVDLMVPMVHKNSNIVVPTWLVETVWASLLQLINPNKAPTDLAV